MRTGKTILLLGTLSFLAACGPQGTKDQPGSTPPPPAPDQAIQTDQGAQSLTDGPPDLAADEALVLADRVHLAPAAGGTDGPAVTLGTKVKVLETTDTAVRVQAPDGPSGWVPAAAVAQEVRQAVVKTDGPDGWPKLTFVGYKPLADDQSKVEAWAAPAAGGTEVRKADLPRSVLSASPNDVGLVVLWRLAALETEPAAKAAKLNEALSKFSSSGLAPLVQAALEAQSGKTVLPTTEVSLIVTAVSDGTKVWAEPAEKGTPVATLAADQQVQVVEQSTDPQTVGGTSARWYKLADPAGWVFGADVKQ